MLGIREEITALDESHAKTARGITTNTSIVDDDSGVDFDDDAMSTVQLGSPDIVRTFEELELFYAGDRAFFNFRTRLQKFLANVIPAYENDKDIPELRTWNQRGPRAVQLRKDADVSLRLFCKFSVDF
jgi:hypothetical protein